MNKVKKHRQHMYPIVSKRSGNQCQPRQTTIDERRQQQRARRKRQQRRRSAGTRIDLARTAVAHQIAQTTALIARAALFARTVRFHTHASKVDARRVGLGRTHLMTDTHVARTQTRLVGQAVARRLAGRARLRIECARWRRVQRHTWLLCGNSRTVGARCCRLTWCLASVARRFARRRRSCCDDRRWRRIAFARAHTVVCR